MIIESIEIVNFLSYYGKNVFTFDTGTTIVIGQNNTGKSKLFDAFNWVIYDKAYKTEEEEWLNTNKWTHNLLNQLAKKECKLGQDLTTEVNLAFKGDDCKQYVVSRSYKITKKNEHSWDWDNKSYLYIEERDAITANCTSHSEADAQEIINRLFPTNLSKYFLFQGESISKIMSLGTKSAFNNALRDLSRIEVFELARDYTLKTQNRCKRELNEKTDANERIQNKKLELDGQIVALDNELSKRKQEAENIQTQRDLAKQELGKKKDELRNYEECAEILRSISAIEERMNLMNKTRETLYQGSARPLFEKWMYAGTGNILGNFLNIFSKNKIEKKIPEPIRQEFVREMLEEQECKVCGREAPKGSDSYHNIEKMLNEKSLDNEMALINTLTFQADNMLSAVNEIPTDIKELYKDLGEIENNLQNLQGELKNKHETLRTVIPKGLTEDSLQLGEFERIRNSVTEIERDISGYSASNNKLLGIIEKIEEEKTNCEKSYSEVIKQSEAIEETERYELAKKIYESTSKFYICFLKNLINSIETEADRCFRQMTELNPALSGRVKVDNAESEVYTVDEAGDRLTNINQANKVSLQIAFVAAVLSVSNSFWDTYFPFIADAPITALGGNNKLATINAMADIFQQSIIMLKDDAITSDQDSVKNDLVRQMIRNDKNIKNAYELTMTGGTLEEQHTKTSRLN